MQIPPSHHLLHALGATPSPPQPVRSAAAAATPEPVAPGRDIAPPPPHTPRPDLAACGAAACGPSAASVRPGARVDMLV